LRWNAGERPHLFATLGYSPLLACLLPGCLPKVGSKVESSIWNKLFGMKTRLEEHFSSRQSAVTYYSRKVNSFLQALNFVPEVRDGRGAIRPPSEFKSLSLRNTNEANAVFCLLNSSLFRWFMDVVSDGSHLNRREIDLFPFDPRQAIEACPEIAAIASRLTKSLKGSSEKRIMRYKHDTLTVQCIIPKFSKNVIDEIDEALGKYYKLTADEIDFIVNYDIKYRMGQVDEEAHE
jgi:hypothetical protein